VRVKEHVIPEEFLHGNYLDDEKFRDRFQGWVRELWEEKDRFIDRLIREYRENPLPKEAP
jgi:hypothetical protein